MSVTPTVSERRPSVSQVSVRRYAERRLGQQSSTAALDDVAVLTAFRRRGVDVDDIRDRLYSAAQFAMEHLAPVVIQDGMRVVMDGGSVDTVQHFWWRKPRRKRLRWQS